MASPGSALCTRCQIIDFDEIFDGEYGRNSHDIRGQPVLDLGPVQGLISGCSLCNLFAAMAKTDESYTSCDLLLAPTKLIFLYRSLRNSDEVSKSRTVELDDTFLLFLEPSWIRTDESVWPSRQWARERGYLSSVQPTRHSPHIGFRVISPEIFDHEFVKDSISYCSANHGPACSPQIKEAPDFFRVIDCKKREVVEAPPSCRYLALSYVWGATTRASDESRGDLDHLPKVITDSIDVTLKLMFQYLWVDRYCIDQGDEADKHRQIRQMDLVYANAEATIIAAAGDDPEYGLPGVNGTLRKEQPQLHVRGHLLASTLPHPGCSVNNSKWATRGWTYQESILSKRRILFTDDQVLFECNSMHCTESQSSILDELHNEDKNKFKLGVAGSAFKWKTPGWNPADIIHFLADFSKRELSYPTDAINAMQGIFQMFSKSQFPVYHVEGVPIVSTTSGTFVSEYSFIKGLSWYHANPGKRRPEFPSWSWAGWTGHLEENFMYKDWDPLPRSITTVRLETENEAFEKFPNPNKDDWQEFLSKRATMRVKIICIQGQTLQCTLVHTTNEGTETQGGNKPKDGYVLKFEVEENIAVYLTPKLDLDESQLEGKTLACICLAFSPRQGIRNHLPMLVVNENTDGLAERVGCCDFDSRHVRVDRKWVYPRKTHYWTMLKKKLERRTIRLG